VPHFVRPKSWNASATPPQWPPNTTPHGDRLLL
jgi:hypothetical protein